MSLVPLPSGLNNKHNFWLLSCDSRVCPAPSNLGAILPPSGCVSASVSASVSHARQVLHVLQFHPVLSHHLSSALSTYTWGAFVCVNVSFVMAIHGSVPIHLTTYCCCDVNE